MVTPGRERRLLGLLAQFRARFSWFSCTCDRCQLLRETDAALRDYRACQCCGGSGQHRVVDANNVTREHSCYACDEAGIVSRCGCGDGCARCGQLGYHEVRACDRGEPGPRYKAGSRFVLVEETR